MHSAGHSVDHPWLYRPLYWKQIQHVVDITTLRRPATKQQLNIHLPETKLINLKLRCKKTPRYDPAVVPFSEDVLIAAPPRKKSPCEKNILHLVFFYQCHSHRGTLHISVCLRACSCPRSEPRLACCRLHPCTVQCSASSCGTNMNSALWCVCVCVCVRWLNRGIFSVRQDNAGSDSKPLKTFCLSHSEALSLSLVQKLQWKDNVVLQWRGPVCLELSRFHVSMYGCERDRYLSREWNELKNKFSNRFC